MELKCDCAHGAKPLSHPRPFARAKSNASPAEKCIVENIMNRLEMLKRIAQQRGKLKTQSVETNGAASEPRLEPTPKNNEIALQSASGITASTTANSGEKLWPTEMPTKQLGRPLPTPIQNGDEMSGDVKADSTKKPTKGESSVARLPGTISTAGKRELPEKPTIENIRLEIWQTMRDYRAGRIDAKSAAITTRSLRDIMRTIKMELEVIRDFGDGNRTGDAQRALGYEAEV